MDPLTLSVHQLHEALRVRLSEPPPGVEPLSTTGATRLIVEGVSPQDLLKSLRLYEYRDDNRHPFVVLTDRMDSEAQFVRATLAQLAGDEANVREGLAEEGISVARTRFDPAIATVPELAALIKRFAQAVAVRLAGVVVVLAPERVADEALYERLAQALVSEASRSELIVLVVDRGRQGLRDLVPDAVAMLVDRRAVLEHAAALKSPDTVGPARQGAPRLSPQQRGALEKRLGRRTAGRPTSEALRELLMQAGAAQSEGKFDLAAKKFRAARTLCRLTGLRNEQAMCAIAVGTAHFSCGSRDRAMEAYREALTLAVELGVPQLVMQSQLAIATTHFANREFTAARDGYVRTHSAAAGMVAMQIESLRMQGECFVGEGRPADAVELWLRTIDEVEALAPLLRTGTSYRMVGERLGEQLERLGQSYRAAEVEQRIARIDQGIEQAVLSGREQVEA